MSTSDFGSGDLARLMDLTGASGAAPTGAGLPDTAILTRLANEFFGTLGGQGATIPGLSTAIPTNTASTDAAMRIAAPTIGISPTISALPTSATPTNQAMPVPSPNEFALVPGFAFLKDTRSIDTMAQAATGQIPGSSTPIPSESQLRTLAAMSPAAPGVQAIPAALAIPTSAAPGTSTAISPMVSSLGTLPASPTIANASPATGTAVPGLSLIPGFEFLADTRSLEAAAQSAANQAAMPGATSPSESQLRSLSSVTPSAPGVQAIPAAPAASSVAGAGVPLPTGSAALPGMGTLTDPTAAARMAGLPATSGTTAAPAGTADALPFGLSLADLNSPQLLGAATPNTDFMRGGSFGFAEMLRPLESFGAAPTLGAIPTNLGGVSSLDSLTKTGGGSSLGGLRAADISSIPFDVQSVRRDFPILQERVNGRQLVWLDNAATTQKPQSVIDRLAYFYAHENSNVHRAAHTLAARSTDAYEAAREKVRRFLNATETKEIIFVRGTTEAINLVAQSWGRRNVQKDDEILITHLEHHANIVPWQMLCAQTGAKLRVAPVDDSGQIILEEYEKLLNPLTRLVAFSHVSNALGTVTPVKQMVEMAHRHGAKVLVDGAQSVAHTRVDMQEYDCDFFVFSGHKIFAPTGIGVVYGKSAILESTPPWQGGGNMIADVTFEKTVYNPPPVRFEAGTGNIADAVGLGAALDYLDRIGMPNISRYEHDLLLYGTEVLQKIPGVRLIGTAKEKASVLSFVLDGFRTEDVGAALAKEGIAVRAGHHCAQPILRRFGVESTVRPSLAFYNTCEELDALAAAIWNIKGGRTPSVI